MKKFIKFTVAATAAVLGISLVACAGKDGGKVDNNGGDKGKKPYALSDEIKSLEWMNYVTGPNSVGHTNEYAVGGTDLGFPIYNSTNDKMHVAFGDTFMDAASQSGLWRSNVLGWTDDHDLSDGLNIKGFKTGGGNAATAIIDGWHMDEYEMTKIPTGGIEVNGVLYMWYFSKYSWNGPAVNSMNYGGAVKSTDDGQTWSRVNDLSWLDDSVPDRKAHVEKLANEDISMHAADSGITMETHAGYSFTQIFPIDGKDGYVYILGEGGYRSGGIRLGRVKYADIEVFEKYEYYNGCGADGKPIWLKGSAGLKTVEANKKAYIISDRCSEQSAMYNKYLKKWMVFYLNTSDAGIMYRTADNIYGPYSEAKVAVPYAFDFPDGLTSLYAGCVHEKWTENDGETMYIIISKWKPVYNSSLMKIVFK